MLYACDRAYWRASSALADFQGLKVTGSSSAQKEFPELELVNVERRTDLVRFNEWASVGDGGNSGFQALNLVLQMGATRVVLVGFDLSLERGVHWHGRHGAGLNNPREESILRWRRGFEASAPMLAELGIEVYNASPHSALEAFPKRSLEELIP